MPIPNPKKRLLFHQVCEGDFTRDAQIEFEKMQQLFDRTNQKVTMTMKISLLPVSVKKGMPDRFKEIDYEITPAIVKKVSEKYVVEVNDDGVIVGDGKTINDILQEELCDADTGESVIVFAKKMGGQ